MKNAWRGIVGLAVLALTASCGGDAETPHSRFDLADAPRDAPARDADGRFIVVVTRDGRVLHAGKAVTLDELDKILEAGGDEPQVDVRADGDARWCHVQWVLAVAGQHGIDEASFTFELNGTERSLTAQIHNGSMANNWPLLPCLTNFIRVRILREDDAIVYRMGERTTIDGKRLGVWMREVAALVLAPRAFAIEASVQTPFRHCLAVLNEFHRAGVEPVTWGLIAPHPWVMRQRRLPEPRGDYVVSRWSITDLVWKDLLPMSLPVASWAECDMDDDPDDRVILSLDSTGQLHQRRRMVRLDRLAALLEKEKHDYDLKQRGREESGYEEVGPGRLWSKLFVLVRADKDVRWQAVKRTLQVLHDEKIYKIQFAATKTVALDYTEEEARQLDAKRVDSLPGSGEMLAAKLSCFQTTVLGARPDARFIDVAIDHAGDRTTYRLDGRSTEDLAVLREWIAARPVADDRFSIVGRIDAPDDTPFKYVVAVVNKFNEAGRQTIDFVGVPR